MQSPVETLFASSQTSPGSPGRGTLQSKSYLSNDPALVVLYHQLRAKTLQTLKGASQVRPREEWEFVLRNARLYVRMGCDFLALDLVRHWEFLCTPPASDSQPSPETDEDGVDYRKLLRRRSSLVVADMPVRLSNADGSADKKDSSAIDDSQPKAAQKPKPPPTMFHEPDSNSLLDSFGF